MTQAENYTFTPNLAVCAEQIAIGPIKIELTFMGAGGDTLRVPDGFTLTFQPPALETPKVSMTEDLTVSEGMLVPGELILGEVEVADEDSQVQPDYVTNDDDFTTTAYGHKSRRLWMTAWILA